MNRTAVIYLISAILGLIADLRAEGRTDSAETSTQTGTEIPPMPSAGGSAAPLDFAGGVTSRTPVQAVSTFESIGLYWKPDNSAEARDCAVRYRPVGTETWHQGLPLWYDARDLECRGSLVQLTPDTAYEIELLEPATKMLARVEARTWSENFPIGKTITLPEFSDETLTVDESGEPNGYVLVTPQPGAAATIDVGGRAASNIVITGSYVIVRGLRLVNAGRSAIVLDKNIHDIVIEENDISGWGRVSPDGWGTDMDAAIYSDYSDKAPLERAIIQRNKMHHPRADANAWDEYRKEYNTGHPLGPQAIFLWNTGGNHVIRYNEVYSDDTHKFNDCIGGGENFSKRGFPHRDSDIYGNKLSQCWDDAIESEGGNANVRIWGNYIDMSYVMIAAAATEIGPIYLWRNVADRSRQSGRLVMAMAKRGVFLKSQSKEAGERNDKGEREHYGEGRIYVFHNTLLQREGENEGVYAGLSDLSGRMSNVTSRNNILHVTDDQRPSIADKQRDPSNDFDFDLYNGRINVLPGQEPNGVRGTPVYSGRVGEGAWALDPSSPGFDAGVVLPNFSNGFSGAAPDMGAQEAGTAPMQFGVDAYR
ncbi:MAG: hypothetical protein L0Z07_05975 [Planctomycetes bacterium]|nr:hypothetical protein [Planctomycetota bacterium]